MLKIKHAAKALMVFTSGIFVSGIFAGCATLQQGPAGYVRDPLSAIVHFYRGPLDHLAAVRGGTCAMYPCSSGYSLECVEKHGLWIGWIMTCDRLLRSGRDELYLSPEITMNGRTFCYDPVEANDFWWHRNDPGQADGREAEPFPAFALPNPER